MLRFYRKNRIYFSVIFVFLLCLSFYQLGLPISSIVALGVVFLIFVLIRGPLSKKIDEFISKKFPYLDKLPIWQKKIINLACFFLLYVVLKQAIFLGFKTGGIDVKDMILKSIPQKHEHISTLGNDSLDKAVTEFLLSKNDFVWKTEEGSENFCVFENLYPEKYLFPIYIWVRCGEFKKTGDGVKELSGISVPIKIDYPNALSYYDLNRFIYEIPSAGLQYAEEIKTIFPKEVQGRLGLDRAFLNDKILELADNEL